MNALKENIRFFSTLSLVQAILRCERGVSLAGDVKKGHYKGVGDVAYENLSKITRIWLKPKAEGT